MTEVIPKGMPDVVPSYLAKERHPVPPVLPIIAIECCCYFRIAFALSIYSLIMLRILSTAFLASGDSALLNLLALN